MMSETIRLVATVGILTGLAACDDATGPAEGRGQVEVAAVGDSESASSSSASESASTAESSGEAEGTVHFSARVYLLTESGQWVEVTERAAQEATVDASGRGEAQAFASAELDAQSYTRVRVVFDEVRADVTGGVTLGVGGMLTGEVRVDAGGSSEPAVVEREVEVRVNSGGTSRVIVDLNSSAWLSGASAETRTVSRAEFENAVLIRSEG